MIREDRPVELIRLLLDAFRWVEDGLLAMLAERGWTGLGRPHSAVFGNLDPGGTRISELARRMGVTRQSAHQVVSELRELGLVRLEPDPTNASAKLVVLTRRGRTQAREGLRTLDGLEEELARRIGANEARALRQILELDWGPPVSHASGGRSPS